MTTEPLPEAEIRHGTKIGRFVVSGELGAGGMGVVYAAHDRELDRQVALKVMRSAAATEEDRMRMLREGQAMARVRHPNVITVYEVGTEGTMVFLAQELLDGGTLGQWLTERRPHKDVIDKFVAAGRGLAAAHAASLVHRDFKPDNVLLGKDGRVCVSDFGLARPLNAVGTQLAITVRAGKPSRDADLSMSPMSPLTRTGAIMGTPIFMAPEQHNGERADERSDQFAFCVALYQGLYGVWPFAGKTAVALADNVIHGRIQPPPRGDSVPSRLRKILLRGLATNPAERHPSIEALLAELTRAPSRRFKRLAIVAGSITVVAGAVVGGYVLRSKSGPAPVRDAAPVDAMSIPSDRFFEWLTTAMERGQLDDAIEKYEMARPPLPAEASIASSAMAFALALRGRLDDAEARLKDADANKRQDPLAISYTELAAAAIASGRGDLGQARDRSRACARSFVPTLPVLAALCHQIDGEAAAEQGDTVSARKAFEDGRAIATQHNSKERGATLDLALAELDLDEGVTASATASASEIQTAAIERGGMIPEAHARIVIGRARLAEAESQKALDTLEQVRPATIQPLRTRLLHAIALGQTLGTLGDPRGLEGIEEARAEAERQGFAGLVLEARLAHVTVMVTSDTANASAEVTALVKDARTRGFGRIARLAEKLLQP